MKYLIYIYFILFIIILEVIYKLLEHGEKISIARKKINSSISNINQNVENIKNKRQKIHESDEAFSFFGKVFLFITLIRNIIKDYKKKPSLLRTIRKEYRASKLFK